VIIPLDPVLLYLQGICWVYPPSYAVPDEPYHWRMLSSGLSRLQATAPVGTLRFSETDTFLLVLDLSFQPANTAQREYDAYLCEQQCSTRPWTSDPARFPPPPPPAAAALSVVTPF
jgi:hypothetical protein